MSPSDVHAFLSEICCVTYYPEGFKSEREKQTIRAIIVAKPRFYVWRTALFFLALTSLRLDTVNLEHQTIRLRGEAEKAELETLRLEAERARRIAVGLSSRSNSVNAYGLQKPGPSGNG
jgi:hypothetical protein